MVRNKSKSPRKSTAQDTKKRTQYRAYTIENRQYKVSVTMLKSIRALQTSTSLCIPRLPFSRLIREILQYIVPDVVEWRVQALALNALQEAAEIFLTQLFEDSYSVAMHAKRVTLKPKDITLVLELRGPSNPGLP